MYNLYIYSTPLFPYTSLCPTNMYVPFQLYRRRTVTSLLKVGGGGHNEIIDVMLLNVRPTRPFSGSSALQALVIAEFKPFHNL
jgi:hypothetical protein